jgi:hypothetical protein
MNRGHAHVIDIRPFAMSSQKKGTPCDQSQPLHDVSIAAKTGAGVGCTTMPQEETGQHKLIRAQSVNLL